jgi:hypothetical protein
VAYKTNDLAKMLKQSGRANASCMTSTGYTLSQSDFFVSCCINVSCMHAKEHTPARATFKYRTEHGVIARKQNFHNAKHASWIFPLASSRLVDAFKPFIFIYAKFTSVGCDEFRSV